MRRLFSSIRIRESLLLTADHSNCEEMIDPITGEPHTQHTTYPVPCLIVDQDNWQLSCAGSLANVAPTLLQLMEIRIPSAMRAGSLLLKQLRGWGGMRSWKGRERLRGAA